ncbi:MAG: arginine--tRNA ligase [Clostridiales bacterium]|jgi:arginyl-tRNA synthetase|nr:arginine--tRNA ligase [Clostridiales bacterium]
MLDIKKIIGGSIVIEGIDAADIAESLTFSDEPGHGDLALPCFKFAKALRKPPVQIAQALIDSGVLSGSPYVEKTEAAGGYFNIYLKRARFGAEALSGFLSGGAAAPFPKNGRRICIDYSSINIAKPFHIGHLLTTVIGGSLYRIFTHLGYDVVGINHLGDWGTQFGKLISAYKRWGDDADIAARGVRGLLDLYVRFHKEAKNDPALDDEGRAYFKRIEDGDAEALKLFGYFREITLKDVGRVYDMLDVTFDSYNGESFYNDRLPAVVKSLEEKGLLTDSEGAKVVDLSDYGMPPCLILKSDGASLYATRDLATAVYRKETYDFCENLYVVAYQQNLHFKQVFQVLTLMGYDWAGACKHIPFGMVSLEETGALSTRSGNVVFLEDVLNTAVAKADAIIKVKNPTLRDRAETAKRVGVGAVIFTALANNRIKDMVFSYDRCLSFEGETGPYLQYTYARCRSVIEKAGAVKGGVAAAVFSDDDAFFLLKRLNDFSRIVAEAGAKYEPSILSRYLIDVAKSFNRFYLSNRVLTADADVSFTRLALVGYTAEILKKGLQLILLKAPEKM